ncbi:hypothetical protein [Nonomuraea jabiensis]|uniref:hypothetical protein n=1 Tax=Nonomuraea jabiensis TaxID=882448 RepID=UPI0036B9D7A7
MPDVFQLPDRVKLRAIYRIGVPRITPPITVTVLSAVPDARADTARAADLIVVAALPLPAGLPQDASSNPAALDRGFDGSMLISGGLFILGGLLAWFGIPRPAGVPAEFL